MRRFKFLKTYLITAAITFVIGIGIFLLFYFLKGQGLTAAIDGTAFAAIILGGVALLMLVANYGAFDGFAFGFKQLSYKFKRTIGELPQYHEYIEEKNTKRKASPKLFIPILIVAGVFLIALAILEIIYAANFA